MDGLLRRRIPIIWRRLLTAIPALILLGLGLEPTRLLILSQVILSFGIPFALIPLVRIAADRDLMHLVPTRRATIGVAWLVIGIVTALNAILILLTVLGPWHYAGHLLRTITRRASRVESSLLATTSTRSEESMSATFESCPFSRTLVSLLST